MKVFLAAGGWFHSHHMAEQLNARNSLCRYVTTANLPKSFTKTLNGKFVHIPFVNRVESIVGRIPGLSSALPAWKWKDPGFARIASHLVPDECDLGVLFASYALPTLEAKREKKIPFVLECSSAHIVTQARLTGHRYTDAFMKWRLDEYRLADSISVPSNFVAQSFVENGIEEKKLKVIPLGVDTNLFKRQPISFRPFQILFVGALSRQKGVFDLFDAWEKIHSKPNAELVLIGAADAEARSRIRSAPGNVRHIPLIDQTQLPSYLAKASVLVLPSHQDGFGMVVLEAMACGLPVIVSKNCGVSELVQHGKDGFVIEPNRADLLAECLSDMQSDENRWKAMGEAAYQKAQQHSWNKYGDRIMAHYNSIIF